MLQNSNTKHIGRGGDSAKTQPPEGVIRVRVTEHHPYYDAWTALNGPEEAWYHAIHLTRFLHGFSISRFRLVLDHSDEHEDREAVLTVSLVASQL
jgi:hypothetical protein